MMLSKELLSHAKALKILFAEDHDDLREATVDILNTFFQEVDSAKNGEEALEIYARKGAHYYDIVLTDIKMPKLNGVALTESIYNMNPDQSVVVLSAHDESKYLLPLINLGVEQFIQKPLDYQELMSALTNIAKKIQEKAQEGPQIKRDIVHLDHECFYDKSKKLFYRDGKNVYFTKYEIMFFTLLTRDLGKIYNNETIVEYFNSLGEQIDPQNIRKLVSKLRKKIPAEFIESTYGVGYRLVPQL